MSKDEIDAEMLYKHDKCAFCDIGRKGYEFRPTSDSFMFCGRCRIVVYCSKDHQIAHYKAHRDKCRNNVWKSTKETLMASKLCTISDCQCKLWQKSLNTNDGLTVSKTMQGPNSGKQALPKLIHESVNISTLNSDFTKLLHKAEESDISNNVPSNVTQRNGSFASNSIEMINETTSDSSQTTVLFYGDNESESVSMNSSHPVPLNLDVPKNHSQDDVHNLENSSTIIPFQHRNISFPLVSRNPKQATNWIREVCQLIITDLDRYGVSVVDNFLGELRGQAILNEVESMYTTGSFSDGELVRKGHRASHQIRGDKITWVKGTEPYCKNVAVLMKLVDNIVMGANSLPNNGKLGQHRIKERSKAMIACYPGNGTHYVKHVDNPNDDGRCVTAIYYLNKDWNTKENGGLLRIFPEGWSHQVADIEPLFDRVVFFWSDRRNPHEVQPAYKIRYAITLWYFDSNVKNRIQPPAAITSVPTQQYLKAPS